MPNTIKRRLADWVRDTREIYYRKFPGPLKGLPNHNLSSTQVFPGGDNFLQAISEGTKKKFSSLGISPDMPMASIGTCFAEEFATYLKENPEAGEYLYLEPNVFNSSANWGRVYTIKNLRQIIEYSFSDLGVYCLQSKKGFIDPLREYSTGLFPTEEEARIAIQKHRELSRQVFLSAKIFAITLGQNETWFDNKLNIYWGAIPSYDIKSKEPERFRPVEFSYEENRDDLDFIITTIKKHNPGINIIITISPVGAAATFLAEEVVAQSFAGKCLLRAVVHEITGKHKDFLYYYPSFELVLCDNPVSYRADNRHVKRKKVNQIFKLLGDILSGK